MTTLQFFSLLIPVLGSVLLVVLAWLNQNQRGSDLSAEMNRRFTELKTDMNKQFDRLDQRLSLIKADQKQFFTVTGKLDGRIDELHRIK